jgi:hypothetical protein
LRGLPKDVRLLLAEEDDFMLFSSVRKTFYGAYRDRLVQADDGRILLSPQSWETYDKMATAVRP